MTKELSAGIIIYRRTSEGPKFLLLYNGGKYWNFPKGKLADGERSFQAALREVYEETGLSSQDLHFREWFKVQDTFSFIRNREKIYKTVIYYLAETRNQKIQINIKPEHHKGEHHEGYGWFLHKEAVRLISGTVMKGHISHIYENLIHKKGISDNRPHSARQGGNIQRYRHGSREPARVEGGWKRSS